MKKYIITESQIYDLKNASVVGDALLNSLKPIEPMTPAEVKAMSLKYPAEDLCGWSYRMGIADAEWHIIGEQS